MHRIRTVVLTVVSMFVVAAVAAAAAGVPEIDKANYKSELDKLDKEITAK